MKRDLYIEMLKKYNELANSQLEFYHKYCKYLTDKIERYERREKEEFEVSLKERLNQLSSK